MIAIDSLDEARTHAVLGGASKDTIVTYLVEFRHQWPTWLCFLATSRPDVETKTALRPLTGDATIDVEDENNLMDVQSFVEHTMRPLTSHSFRLSFEETTRLICEKAKPAPAQSQCGLRELGRLMP